MASCDGGETRLSPAQPIVTIEHVFGPSLQEIARKWREMAAPKSDGDKPMVAREKSAAPDDAPPVPAEHQND
jgi:cytochrome c551/c552